MHATRPRQPTTSVWATHTYMIAMLILSAVVIAHSPPHAKGPAAWGGSGPRPAPRPATKSFHDRLRATTRRTSIDENLLLVRMYLSVVSSFSPSFSGRTYVRMYRGLCSRRYLVATIRGRIGGIPQVAIVRCLRYTKLCSDGKHVSIMMKPTNSPIQGQPNPRKNRLKVAFGPLFPTANNFSWVGIGFIQETDYKKPNPTKFSAKHPIILRGAIVIRTHDVPQNPHIPLFLRSILGPHYCVHP